MTDIENKDENLSRKKQIAWEYIDKISQDKSFDELKNILSIKNTLNEFKEILSMSKDKLNDNNILTDKIKENLKDFLVTENLIDWIKENKHLFLLSSISQDWQNQLSNAKEIINSDKTEDEIRLELWLWIKGKSWLKWDENINTKNEYIENIVYPLSNEDNNKLNEIVQKSKEPNNVNYLEENVYKKYLNHIEASLNLPKNTLQSVCYKESEGKLYKWSNIIWSSAGAKWLFQFMPSTARWYMANENLKKNYWKTFSSEEEFIKDPLATAWASGIMLSENMRQYNLQTALACYNWWPGNVKNKIWWLLKKDKFHKLPKETQNYVEKISNSILKLNWEDELSNIEDILNYNLSKFSIKKSEIVSPSKEKILIGSEILATSADEIWWLWNSMMTGFQWYKQKDYFRNMDWVEWKNTETHPNRFNSQDDVRKRKDNHPSVKSFVMYFGANTKDNNQTLKDLEKWSIWLKEEWIQPVLSTCIGADNHPHLNKLNLKILRLWKKLETPVLDFADKYNRDKNLFDMWSNKHPSSKWYTFMKDEILSAANIS